MPLSDANRFSSGPRADAYRLVKFDGPPVPGAGSLLSFSTGTPVPTSIPIILGIRAAQAALLEDLCGRRPFGILWSHAEHSHFERSEANAVRLVEFVLELDLESMYC